MYNRLFNLTITRVALFVVALMAISLVALPVYNLAFAQETDTEIEYAENGTGAVTAFTASDPEGRMIYWSLLSDLEGSPAIDGTPLTVADREDDDHFSISAGGVLSFVFPPDYEMPRGLAVDDNTNTNTYNVVVVASDDAPGAGTVDEPIRMGYKKVEVEVTDVDEPGVLTLSSLQPQVGVDLMATITDPEVAAAQTAATWKWESSTSRSGGWQVIPNQRLDTYEPVQDLADNYLRVTATYVDSTSNVKTERAISAEKIRLAPAANENETPTGVAETRSVDENSAPGTNVGDPVTAMDANEDDVLTYTLGTGGDRASYRIDPGTGQITVGPRVTLDRENNVSDTVTVTATDPSDASVDITVTININDVNEAPMINMGATKISHVENSDITTAALATYTVTNPETTGDSTAWSVSGADSGDFMINTDGELRFRSAPDYEMPADANRDNMYMVTVEVSDSDNHTARRDVIVRVTNAEDTGEVTLSSDQAMVGTELTASLADPDGGEIDVIWQWASAPETNGDCPAATGNWTDIEDDADEASYTPVSGNAGDCLRVTASYTDAVENADTDTAMAVSANAVSNAGNLAPKFARDMITREVVENSADTDDTNVGAVVTATDPNADTMNYSLSGDAGPFMIDRLSGQITVKTGAMLDRETKDQYIVTVTAQDPNQAMDTVMVTIKITDEDEAPEIAGDNIDEDYAENGTGPVETFTASDPEGRMIYWSLLSDLEGSPAIDGTPLTVADREDDDHFSISAGGVLSFVFPPDYEMPRGLAVDDNTNTNTYNVVVVASDDAPGAGTVDEPIRMGYKKVEVEVTDVDEPGVLTLSSLQPQVGVDLMATITDPEVAAAQTAATWKWESSTSRSGGWRTIDGETVAAYEPVQQLRNNYLRVTATYVDADANTKVERAISAEKIRLAPAANENETPTGVAETRSVDENSAPGTNVGDPVTAMDANEDDVLTYTLGTGGDRASYRIDPGTGQITVGPRVTLDRENNVSDTVTVTATDPSDASVDITVTININDVNEAPMINMGATKISHVENSDITTAALATYTVTNPETTGDSTAWSVSGADSGDFMINTDGELRFRSAPDYEMPADANRDNMYMVTVEVSDSDNHTARRDVIVRVTNAEDTGEVTLSSDQAMVGTELTASLADPDGGEIDVIWQWASAPETNGDCPAATGNWTDIEDDADEASYTPVSGNAGDCLRVTASYTDAVENADTDTAMAVSANAVSNAGNLAPKFARDMITREVVENSADTDDTNVGAVVTATDPNADILNYSLSGDAGPFMIDRLTGQITVRTGAMLDHEAKDQYIVTVTAQDPNQAMDTVMVTIKITDEDEAPEIMESALAPESPMFPSATTSRNVAENTALSVRSIGAPVRATDRNGDTLVYSLGGTDAASFTIDTGDGSADDQRRLGLRNQG